MDSLSNNQAVHTAALELLIVCVTPLPSLLFLLYSFIWLHCLLRLNSKAGRAGNDRPCYCQANRNGAKVESPT